MNIKQYFQGLKDEGLKSYLKDRKVLFIFMMVYPFFRSNVIRAGFKRGGFIDGMWDLLLYMLVGIVLYLTWKAAYFIFRRWRYGKELEEWKAKEATPEYQDWFNALTPEEQMVELQKKNNIIAEQTRKTSKTTTAASIFTAGAAGKVVKVKKK